MLATNSITYAVNGSDGYGCSSVSSATGTLTVFPNTTVSVSDASICAGEVYTINANGANSYSYSIGQQTLSPLSNFNYSVTGFNAQGCISSNIAVATLSVFPLPTITVNSGSVCLGETFTIQANGASTFTYSTGQNTIVPSSLINYSVSGTSTVGCVSQSPAMGSVIVFLPPIMSINSGSICYGESFTITPNGATFFTLSTGQSVISPANTLTYSLFGASAQGCLSNAPVIGTLTVFQPPQITTNSGSVCAGQAFTIQASGASTYTYSTVQSIFVPISSGTYFVSGTSAEGCVGTNSVSGQFIVMPRPFVSTNSGYICRGESFSITPIGAANYTVSTGQLVISPPNTLTYSVIGISAHGCEALSPAIGTITVFQPPTISVNSGTICLGASFVVNPTGASSYSINTNSFTLSPLTTQTFAVIGTSNDGCVSLIGTIGKVEVDECLGLNRYGPSEIKIYPNPNHGIFSVKMTEPKATSIVTIYDALGQIIYSDQICTNEMLIDLSRFSMGIYFLWIHANGNLVYSEKIVMH